MDSNDLKVKTIRTRISSVFCTVYFSSPFLFSIFVLRYDSDETTMYRFVLYRHWLLVALARHKINSAQDQRKKSRDCRTNNVVFAF